MKIQKTLITLFLLNYLSNIYAQEPIGTISTTGNEKIERDVNGGLTEFIDFKRSVDLSTGKIYPKIELLSLDSKQLKTNVSIVYNSGNNRVNEISGELGMGWSLNAGAYITREVRGIPDESTAFNSVPSSSDQNECNDFTLVGDDYRLQQSYLSQCYFSKGYHYMGVQGKGYRKGYLDYHVKNCYPWGSPLSGEVLCDIEDLFGDQNEPYTYAEMIDDFVSKPILNQEYPTTNSMVTGQTWCRINGDLCIDDTWQNYFSGVFPWGMYVGNTGFSYDTEPDVFYFNLGDGNTGKFVFDAKSNPVVIPDNGIKITPAIGKNKSPLNTWIIITTDGTQYYFENTNDYREESWEYFDNHPWFDDDNAGQIPTFIDESKVINRYHSKWYVSKIKRPSGEEILFEYYDQQPHLSYTLPNPVQLDKHPSSDGTISSSGEHWGESKLYDRTDFFIKKNRKSIERIVSDVGEITFDYYPTAKSVSYLQHLKSVTSENFLGDEIKKIDF
ncbi:MAG: hypothetical protein AAF901_12945, partial [Bacteroidota bacterium]